jgi:hypothetical protein
MLGQSPLGPSPDALACLTAMAENDVPAAAGASPSPVTPLNEKASLCGNSRPPRNTDGPDLVGSESPHLFVIFWPVSWPRPGVVRRKFAAPPIPCSRSPAPRTVRHQGTLLTAGRKHTVKAHQIHSCLGHRSRRPRSSPTAQGGREWCELHQLMANYSLRGERQENL